MRHSVSSSPWLRATLLVTLTLSLSACGVGEPPVTPGPGPGIVDRTAPAAPTTLSADAAVEGVTLAWAANSETDLAGYRVSRADGANGPFTNLNTDLLTASQYTDTTAPTGRAVFYRVVAVDNAGNVSAASAVVSATRPAPVVSRAEIAVENLDVTPYPDRLVFSRIQSPASPGQGVHEIVTLRVRSTGPEALVITELPIQGPWTIDDRPSLPLTIPAGQSRDLKVRFTAQVPGPVSRYLHEGNLTIRSNDVSRPALVVQLAGTWQGQSESNDEPGLEDIRRAFGYEFSYANPGQNVSDNGAIYPTGDEVISAYWQRFDENQPVEVTQLAAFHRQGERGTLFWHVKGSGSLQNVLVHDGNWGQSLLPRLNGDNSKIARTTFAPSKTFGFNVDGVEWSDPMLNGRSSACVLSATKLCGHDIRFWPVKDREGRSIPNTYLMLMDYVGINYDYNDNMYLVSNIKPAPILIDVGARNGAAYTDPQGNVWMPDVVTTQGEKRSLVFPGPSGSDAPDEPAQATNVAIANTDKAGLYQTYRALITPVPGNVQDRVMKYTIPLNNGTYTVKMHFAELFWDAKGKRIFDVYAEGTEKIQNLDIFDKVGKNAAHVETFSVTVTDGQLNIETRADVDFGQVAGIEIAR